jgi:hypothetical protein
MLRNHFSGSRCCLMAAAEFGLGHTDADLAPVDGKPVVVADAEGLAILDATVLGESERRAVGAGATQIEAVVNNGFVVLAFLVGGLAVGAGDRDGSAGTAQDVDKSHLREGEVIQPQLPGLATPEAGIDLDLGVFPAVEDEGHFLPVTGRRDADLDRGNGVLGTIDLDAEGAGGAQLLGLHPAGQPVLPMRLDRYLLHDAGMPVREGTEVLEPQRGGAAMAHLGIHEGDLAGPVVESVPRHLLVRVLLETGILEPQVGIGDKAGFLPLHLERHVGARQTGGKVAVDCQARAVAHGPDDGNDLDLASAAGVLDGVEPGEPNGIPTPHSFQTTGQEHAIQAVLVGGGDDLPDLVHVLRLGEIAGDVDPAVGIALLCLDGEHGEDSKGQGEAGEHGQILLHEWGEGMACRPAMTVGHAAVWGKLSSDGRDDLSGQRIGRPNG